MTSHPSGLTLSRRGSQSEGFLTQLVGSKDAESMRSSKNTVFDNRRAWQPIGRMSFLTPRLTLEISLTPHLGRFQPDWENR